MGSGLNNSLKYSLLMDSRNGWYYGQRIVISLTAILSIYTIQGTAGGAKGFVLLSAIFYWAFFFITFISCSIFGSAITEEKEQGILPLVMMTGISSASYISAKLLSKTSQILSLLIILIPPTIFSVTLGGVNLPQILLLYGYLLFWFLFCGSICLWMSVLFSESKEVFFIATPLFIVIIIAMGYGNISPFQRIDTILNSPNISIYVFKEFLFFIPMLIYLFFSSCKNLHFGILFPIKFLEEYLDKIKKTQTRVSSASAHILRPRKRYLNCVDILTKDERHIPVHPLLGNGIANADAATVILFILTIPFTMGFFMSWLFIGPLILTWLRIISVFSHEIEEKTLSSLLMLPISTEELLDKKIESATPYIGLKLFYLLFIIPLGVWAISTLSISVILKALFLIPLYNSMIYVTVLTTVKGRDIVKITSFSICFLLIFLYFALPFASALFYPLSLYLKKRCIKEIELFGEISD